MTALDTVQTALVVARSRLKETPNFGIYASCVAQLEYLLSVIEGSVAIDRPKLRALTIGHYAVREFEETDQELARALKDAYLIASRLGDGLKVE